MKKVFYLLVLAFSQNCDLVAQSDDGFYVDGYILQNEDTTVCKIWLNPASPFNDEINIWLKDQAQTIKFQENKSLVGFGITQQGYKADYGRIRLQGHTSWIIAFAKKVVTGVIEIYEFRYGIMKKNPESFGLQTETNSAYYINRTDHNKQTFPTLLKTLKKKEIAEFVQDFPRLKEKPTKLTPQELVDLAIEYNTWLKTLKPN